MVFENGGEGSVSLDSHRVNTAVEIVAGKVSDKTPEIKIDYALTPKAVRPNGRVNRSQCLATETAAKATMAAKEFKKELILQ